MSKTRRWFCEHGLDLRLYPRCFLCKPLEWPETNDPVPGFVGCRCPTYWFGTVPPECPVHNPPKPYYPTITVGTTTGHTVRCTCPENRGDNYAGNCPIHDVMSSYTVGVT